MTNKNIELIRGEPEKAILKFAIPIIITMLITSLYNIIDAFWITRISSESIAGLGFVTPLFLILNGISVGLGTGATSAISRFIGAKDKLNSDNAATTSIIIFLITSICLTIIFILFLKPILILLGAKGNTLNEALLYGYPLFLGLFTFIMTNGLIGILRGEGNIKLTMYVSLIGVFLNIIFDPIFIYLLKYNTSGAAIATILSNFICLLIFLYILFIKKNSYVNINLKSFTPNKEIIKIILSVGIPGSLNTVVIAIATSLYLICIVTVGGHEGVAAFTVGQRIYLIGIMVLSAIGSATVIVIASNFGAKNNDYIKRAHLYSCKISILIGIAIMLILIIFANPIGLLFSHTKNSESLLPLIVLFLQISALSLPFTGIGIPSNFLYQGLGNGLLSLLWIFIREIVFVVILIYLFGIVLNWGLIGIWIGLSLGRIIANILNYIFAHFTIKNLKNKMNN